MLSEVQGAKSAVRKRVWKQSDAADTVFLERLLAASESTGAVLHKGYSVGSLAVANIAEPRTSNYDVDLMVSNLQPTIVDAGQRYSQKIRTFHRATDTGSVSNWAPFFGQNVRCVGFTPANASTQRAAWDIFSLVNVERPEISPTIWDQTDSLANAAASSGGTVSATYDAVVREADRTSQLDAQVDYLKGLQADWDGYGAKPLLAKAIYELVAILKKALMGINVPAPDLIPGGDGSVQAEWRRKGYKVFFNRESEGEYELYTEEVKSGQRNVFGGADALAKLRDWAARIAD